MFTLALLGAMTLAPAQAAEPEFKNTRYTYGILGQTRKDDKFLPGDIVVLQFDTVGMVAKDDGQVSYSMGYEVLKKGQQKPVYSRAAQDVVVSNTLGTGNFPSFLLWQIPRDEESPGQYTLKVNVTDRQTKKTGTLTRSFTVVPPKLGFIQTYFTALARELVPVPPLAVVGQRLLLHHQLVGFAQDKKDRSSNVTVTIRILDEDGKPTLAKPFTGDIKSDEKAAPGIMLLAPYQIELNRAGKFKVELTARCNISKESVKEVLDLTVVELK